MESLDQLVRTGSSTRHNITLAVEFEGNQKINLYTLALLKAQISLQLGKVFSSDNGVSVSIMYSYTY